jgi:hypothetical protein
MTPAPTNGSVREREEPLPFGGMPLGGQRNICAFLDNPQEEYRVRLPFIKEGIENPFYMPAHGFLHELRSRNPWEAAAAS